MSPSLFVNVSKMMKLCCQIGGRIDIGCLIAFINRTFFHLKTMLYVDLQRALISPIDLCLVCFVSKVALCVVLAEAWLF